MRLFAFSLTGPAKDWLQCLPRGSIATWKELEDKFLERFFTHTLFQKMGIVCHRGAKGRLSIWEMATTQVGASTQIYAGTRQGTKLKLHLNTKAIFVGRVTQ
ncbi:hypothetical protein QL285_093907 [Trifolium repens]|nr:hypothetical protein QL285_093907 [Trifolium repens]